MYMLRYNFGQKASRCIQEQRTRWRLSGGEGLIRCDVWRIRRGMCYKCSTWKNWPSAGNEKFVNSSRAPNSLLIHKNLEKTSTNTSAYNEYSYISHFLHGSLQEQVVTLRHLKKLHIFQQCAHQIAHCHFP